MYAFCHFIGGRVDNTAQLFERLFSASRPAANITVNLFSHLVQSGAASRAVIATSPKYELVQ